MSTPYANYEVVSLTGTQTHETGKGNYVTASTIHEIYCLASGSISITPTKGPTFTWSGTTNMSLNVMVKSTVVNSGTFIGFRGKLNQNQFFGNGNQT